MEIRWSPLATRQLEDIFQQHKDNSTTAAQDICRNIYKEANLLTNFPFLGKAEPHLKGKYAYRSLVAKNQRYKIMYYIKYETIHIAVVWDCRQYPAKLYRMLRKYKWNKNK